MRTARAPVGRAAARLVLVLAVVTAAVVGVTPEVTHRDHPGARPLVVVALGDSVPTGFGCDCAGFAQTVADEVGIETGRPSEVANDAVNGATSGDVVAEVQQESVRSDLARSSLVLLQAGANDVPLDPSTGQPCDGGAGCLPGLLAHLRAELLATVRVVRAGSHPPVVALLGYWNISVDGTEGRTRGPAFVTNSRAVTGQVNAVISAVARATGSVYVDTSTPFLGPDEGRDPTGDLQDDGDHPDASGHRLIADAVVAALRSSGALARLRAEPASGATA